MSGSGTSPQIKVRVPDSLRAKVERLAESEGKRLSDITREALELRAALRPEARVQKELHIALLTKLLDTGLAPYLSLVQRNLKLARSRMRNPMATQWLDERESLISGPLSRLVRVFVGDDERSIDLRQVSPFAGVLSQDERLAAIARGRAAGA